jgi:uncharacterized protein (DUF1499 family)
MPHRGGLQEGFLGHGTLGRGPLGGALLVATGLVVMSQPTDPADLAAGRLRPCPSSPNCVSSQADDDAHRVEPLAFTGDPAAAMERLRRSVESLPGARIVSARDGYLHAEFTSRIFRFVDDVELLLDPEAGVVHVRSASRVGYSDLGANRRRVEAIRRAFGD